MFVHNESRLRKLDYAHAREYENVELNGISRCTSVAYEIFLNKWHVDISSVALKWRTLETFLSKNSGVY